MTFRDVIWKNFTKNIKKYFSYYFSGSFCVAMFFVYSTLMFMDAVKDSDSEYPLFALFLVSCMIICLFSILFVNYAHQIFVKNKKKELGIYMAVGMNENATRKMLGMDTAIVAVSSILTGVLVGSLFSRYFQIIIQKLLDLDDLKFTIKPASYLLTVSVFAVLFLICDLRTDCQMKKEDIISIMKENRKKEGKEYQKSDVILLVVGVALMIFCVLFILRVATNNHINSSLWVLLTFVLSGYAGLFLVISFGVKTYVYLMQRKAGYYRSMLTVSGINQKFQQNSRMIIVLAMLASMIVLLVGSPIALISISADIAEEGNSDLTYLTFQDYDTDKVDQIVKQEQIESWDRATIHYIIMESTGEIKPILSVSEYNEQMGTSLVVNQGELYHMITSWEPGNHGYEAGDTYEIQFGSTRLSYTVCDSVKGSWNYSSLFATKSILILSDQDYMQLQAYLPTAEINQIMFTKGWKTTGDTVEAVRTELEEQLGENYLLSSIKDIYKNIKQGYSVFLFTACFMCFMFFISTGFVLYFKQYNEIDEEKEQYQQLYQIGVSDTVVKRSISVKLAIVYFLPLLGTIMGVLISYYMASIFGGQKITIMFLKKSLIGVLLYSGSQIIFYLVLRVKYLKDVLQNSAE